jgi:hypothetical protein
MCSYLPRVNDKLDKTDFEKNEKQAENCLEKHDNRLKFSTDKSVKICLFSERGHFGASSHDKNSISTFLRGSPP